MNLLKFLDLAFSRESLRDLYQLTADAAQEIGYVTYEGEPAPYNEVEHTTGYATDPQYIKLAPDLECYVQGEWEVTKGDEMGKCTYFLLEAVLSTDDVLEENANDYITAHKDEIRKRLQDITGTYNVIVNY